MLLLHGQPLGSWVFLARPLGSIKTPSGQEIPMIPRVGHVIMSHFHYTRLCHTWFCHTWFCHTWFCHALFHHYRFQYTRFGLYLIHSVLTHSVPILSGFATRVARTHSVLTLSVLTRYPVFPGFPVWISWILSFPDFELPGFWVSQKINFLQL